MLGELALMSMEKVIFGFFIVLALTLNVGFVYGEIDNPKHHHHFEFMAVLTVNLIATVLKLGDRSQVGAILLSTSLVADLQLLVAAMIWLYVAYGNALNVENVMIFDHALPVIVSLSVGAVVANIISVLLLVVETITLSR
jgi:Ca2+/H+ antiporter, TMEM165/GDT1 family